MAVALAGGEGRGRGASRCCFFMADANDAAGKFINMLIPLAAVFVEEEEEEGEAGRWRRRKGKQGGGGGGEGEAGRRKGVDALHSTVGGGSTGLILPARAPEQSRSEPVPSIHPPAPNIINCI